MRSDADGAPDIDIAAIMCKNVKLFRPRHGDYYDDEEIIAYNEYTNTSACMSATMNKISNMRSKICCQCMVNSTNDVAHIAVAEVEMPHLVPNTKRSTSSSRVQLEYEDAFSGMELPPHMRGSTTSSRKSSASSSKTSSSSSGTATRHPRMVSIDADKYDRAPWPRQ
ncbi:hypothetical protein OHC33_003019 [Knufia fluminis]|uniref:Uncharacterized protein n=1 Tax=Knufia fluminis TaxID=191047 RepID=A0AAN8EQP2_9EURO|nr:hypothetical protein OHC33_003019 [Knufia fluminis]